MWIKLKSETRVNVDYLTSYDYCGRGSVLRYAGGQTCEVEETPAEIDELIKREFNRILIDEQRICNKVMTEINEETLREAREARMRLRQ
jgi:hypothetical protein